MKGLLHATLTGKKDGDAWSRVNPESVATRAYEASPPLTSWQTIWYCLWYPPLLWWISTISPPRGKLGAVSRFFWFGYLGLPPKGLLRPWQFSVYLSIILGVPAAVFIIAAQVTQPGLMLFIGALTLAWALVLFLAYFTGENS